MKTLIILATTLWRLIFPLSGDLQREPGYNFIKKEKDVNLWYRWVEMPDKHKVRELKAEFEIASPPEKVISVLKNEKLALKWMKGAIEVQNLGKTDKKWQNYILYDIPWPLSNQDCIIHYHLETSGKNYLIRMDGGASQIPEKEGITRIKHLKGLWIITPTNKGCKVVHTIFSGQAPHFPRWLTDPLIQENFISTMNALRETVENN